MDVFDKAVGGADIVSCLGPLSGLAGTWSGEAGIDVAAGRHGPVETPYRERLQFEPLGPVVNGPQLLYGLRYSTTAWPLGCDDPFHEEVGYWLWDAKAGQVMRCFMVPRGVTINAGGDASADATAFTMQALLGSTTFGILSNPFLDQAFRTVRYDLSVELHEDGAFSYHEDTHLQIHGVEGVFHHTDCNRLTRITD
ncbi:heme-binding beta-barrel domain-containing protein [Mariprofundus ferrooxydans]|uniref:heme-binding beta-barrel domain-containing protein n=1 Tax=Mariprofundus ferrooxydans TaxID=314344 RepID=UPI000372DD16|nr:heme-binding beta-barrel domain-containing protein [Mariprofundus ferrooxydans]